MAIAIGIAWLVFICLGVPIAFVLGASAMVGVLLAPDGLDLLPALVEQMFIAISSFNFLAIPLFVFAGGVLAESGVAKILMDLASITVGRGRGGLGASIVMSAMVFHGISGSSSADAAAIGKVTLPTLRQQGYPLPFSVALLATAGATGTLIPPTMDLIIIGIVGNMSIAGLFSAGILPAFVNGLGLMALVVFISRRRGYGNVTLPFAWRTAALAFLKAIPALFMIAIILGGILGGVFTPTEASSVAVFYGLFLAFVVYRSLTIRQFLGLFRTTIEISGMVLLVIAMAAMLGYALTIFQVPTGLGQAARFARAREGAVPAVRADLLLSHRHLHGHRAGDPDPHSDPHAAGDRARHRADPFRNPGRMQRGSPSGVPARRQRPVHRLRGRQHAARARDQADPADDRHPDGDHAHYHLCPRYRDVPAAASRAGGLTWPAIAAILTPLQPNRCGRVRGALRLDTGACL